jgi:hypothetical protein
MEGKELDFFQAFMPGRSFIWNPVSCKSGNGIMFLICLVRPSLWHMPATWLTKDGLLLIAPVS